MFYSFRIPQLKTTTKLISTSYKQQQTHSGLRHPVSGVFAKKIQQQKHPRRPPYRKSLDCRLCVTPFGKAERCHNAAVASQPVMCSNKREEAAKIRAHTLSGCMQNEEVDLACCVSGCGKWGVGVVCMGTYYSNRLVLLFLLSFRRKTWIPSSLQLRSCIREKRSHRS